MLSAEGFTHEAIAAALDEPVPVATVGEWARQGTRRYDLRRVHKVAVPADLSDDEAAELRALVPLVLDKRGNSRRGSDNEAERARFADLIVTVALRGVLPRTIAGRIAYPAPQFNTRLTNAWRRYVAALPDEPDPFTGTYVRDRPAPPSATAATQFQVQDAAPVTDPTRRRPGRGRRPRVYEYTPESTPRAPTVSAPAALVDPTLRDALTGCHHDATRDIRAAAVRAGYPVTTFSHGQDAAFVVADVLVNVEVKTLTVLANGGDRDPTSATGRGRTPAPARDPARDSAGEGDDDDPDEARGAFTVDARGQLRLGLGQVLEQAQRHRDDLESGWSVPGTHVTSCAPVLAVEVIRARVDPNGDGSAWEGVAPVSFDAPTAALWQTWQRTCARAGVTLATVPALLAAIADPGSVWRGDPANG